MSRQVDVKALVSHIIRGDGADRCRICMGDTSEGQVYLGDTVMEDGDKSVTLGELLETITGVDVEDILPQSICSRCSEILNAAMPFLSLCMESSRKWGKIADFFLLYTVPDNTKNLYVSINGNEIQTAIDTTKCVVAPAKDKRQALKNYRNRMNRRKFYSQRQGRKAQTMIKKELKCPECNTAFVNISKLKSHISNSNMRVCIHCREVFSVEDMKEHLLNTHSIKSYSCKTCSDLFEQKTSLLKHMRTNHFKGSAFCIECKRSFSKNNGLAAHFPTHKLRICEGCNKKFTNKLCFKSHQCSNPVAVSSTYICDYCSKEYKDKNTLRVHIVTVHLKPKLYQCEKCGKGFNSRAALVEHDNAHNRIADRFVCDICDLKYSSRVGYRRHYKQHFGYKRKDVGPDKIVMKFKCSFCESEYRSRHGLNVHSKKKHSIVFASFISD